jgi:2-dehydropantoate 2-reductase
MPVLGQPKIQIWKRVAAPSPIAQYRHCFIDRDKPAPGTDILPTAEMFASAGFRVKVFDDYRRLKWTKLLMNMVANALPAILGWSPERAFSDQRLALLEVAAWREAMKVVDALGIRPLSFGGYPFPVIKPLVERMPAALTAQALRRFVGRGRGGKKPSLLLDLEKGKNRSEVMFLNGAVSSRGKQAGIPTPVNTCLTGLLLSVARGKARWEEFRDRPDAVLTRCREEYGVA